MAGIEVRRLRPDDDRSQFRSGNLQLDEFFRRYAGQNQFRHLIGTTYVATEARTIVGFATVSPCSISIDQLPPEQKAQLPRYPLPALRLARLAVAESAVGRGVGRDLLRTVFKLAREMAEDLGCVGIVVDAKPEAITFYERYGFHRIETLEGNLRQPSVHVAMFLALGSIPRSVAQPDRQ